MGFLGYWFDPSGFFGLVLAQEIFWEVLKFGAICTSPSFLIQKRAAHVILGTDTSSRTTNNFSNLVWIPFYDEAKMNKSAVIYKNLHKESLAYFSEFTEDRPVIAQYIVSTVQLYKQWW